MLGLFTLLTIVHFIPSVTGNARLIEPVMRSSMWRFDERAAVNFNDHALDCGGSQVQHKLNRGRCGVCGDPFNAPRENEVGGRYDSRIIARRYRTGSDVTMVADLLSAKGGFIEIKLCPRNDPNVPVTQACFDQYPLQITNGRRRRLPVLDASKSSNGLYRLDVRLPRGVACTHCVIQWRYHAGNEWGYDANGRGCLGCGPQTDIYNCADVAIGYYGDTEASPGQPADLSMGPLAERIEIYSENTGVSSLVVNSDHASAWAAANQLTTQSRRKNQKSATDYYYDNGNVGGDYDNGNVGGDYDTSGGYANLMSSAAGGNMYDYDDYGFENMMMLMMLGAMGGGGSDFDNDNDDGGSFGGGRVNNVRVSSVNRRGGSRSRGQQRWQGGGGGGGGGGSGSSEEDGGGYYRRNNNRNNNNFRRNNAQVIPSISRQYRRMNVGSPDGSESSGSSEEDDSGERFGGGMRVPNRPRPNPPNQNRVPNNPGNREKLRQKLQELADELKRKNNENLNDQGGVYETNPTPEPNTKTPNNQDYYDYPDNYDNTYETTPPPKVYITTTLPPYFQETPEPRNPMVPGRGDGAVSYGNGVDDIDYVMGNGDYGGGNGEYDNRGQTPVTGQNSYDTPTVEPVAEPVAEPHDGAHNNDNTKTKGTNQNGDYGTETQTNSNTYYDYEGTLPNGGSGPGGSGYDSKNPTTTGGTDYNTGGTDYNTGGSDYTGNNQNVDGYDYQGGPNDYVDSYYDNAEDYGQATGVGGSGTGVRGPYTHPDGHDMDYLDDNGPDDDARREGLDPPRRRRRLGYTPWYMSMMGAWPYNYQQGLPGPYQRGPWSNFNPALMNTAYGRGQVPYSQEASLLSTLNAPAMANAPVSANPDYYRYANGGSSAVNRVLPWMPGATEVMAMGARKSPLFSPQVANHYLSSFKGLSHSHPSLLCPRADQLICVATPAYSGIPNADQICTSKCRAGGACGSDYCSCACQRTLMCVHHASPKGAGSFGVTELDIWCTNQCNAGQCPNQMCACNILF